MRITGGLIVIFILSVIFSYFQGFVDFLINIGIIPDKPEYRTANFDIFMIFIIYGLFMVSAFIIGSLVISSVWILDANLAWKIKKAKKRALKEFGITLPYFYFIDPKHMNNIYFDVSHYVYHLCRQHLVKEFGDFNEADKVFQSLSNNEVIKLYNEVREFYGIPEMPEEYGVLDDYLKEENVC